ncbi:hypothetical protein MCHI_000455 [Candidatus Magnetoovum chiemensis]|nr:hypothetical protein MCHI_000455 [Candidatus Magnetoovum chiemensis]
MDSTNAGSFGVAIHVLSKVLHYESWKADMALKLVKEAMVQPTSRSSSQAGRIDLYV